ncbi:MAG: cyclic nucleotide-binding domain-containing protein [Deltaproteobacteria bacterium]|nr:cyclic nucleotide-binding domain-containing protein [Deltaproteobacteria bacterium]
MSIEFEFSESTGRFQVAGDSVRDICGLLATGAQADAVSLYERSAFNVGSQLLAQLDRMPNGLQRQLASLFFEARDYQRAGEAFERLSDWDRAASAYESARMLDKAAQCHARAGRGDRAGSLLARAGAAKGAATLFSDKKADLRGAAESFERSRDYLGAAKLYLNMGDQKRAIEALDRTPRSSPLHLKAVLVAAEVLIKAGQHDEALRRLAASLPRSRVLTNGDMVDVAYQLGKLLMSMKRSEQAKIAFQMVVAFDPGYRNATRYIEQCDASARGTRNTVPTRVVATPAPPRAAEARSVLPPVDLFPMSEPSISAPPEVLEPFAGQAVQPLRPTEGTVRVRVSQEIVAIEAAELEPSIDPFAGQVQGQQPPPLPGYGLLKELLIFKELSLEEMRDLHSLCELRSFEPGEVMIEQDRPGPGLFIVEQGILFISKVIQGRDVPLREVSVGSFVGEMSLIDDAPTSARVTAKTHVRALVIGREAFQRHMWNSDPLAARVYHSFIRMLSSRLRENSDVLAELKERLGMSGPQGR